MTRLAVLSDIHGNFPALQAVMQDMQSFSPDHVIIAGDLINGGLHDVEVLETVLKKRWTTIRGNHEFYLLEHGTPAESEDKRKSKVLDYLAKTLSDTYTLIAAMPDMLTLHYPDAPAIHVTHGIPGDNRNAITRITPEDEAAQMLATVEEKTFIAGHYHIPFERHINGIQVINPGPVGMMCDGIRNAGYMLLDSNDNGWKATFRRVEYDFAPITARYEEIGDQLGVTGYLAYRQIKYARPLINAFDEWREAKYPAKERTLELVHEFLTSDEVWDYFGEAYQVNPDIMPESFE